MTDEAKFSDVIFYKCPNWMPRRGYRISEDHARRFDGCMVFVPEERSLRHTHTCGSKFSIDDLGVPLAKQLEQLSGVAQGSNGVPLIRRPEGIFQPV